MRTPHELQQILLKWYAQNRRDLPWRQNRNPYRIWVSEIMLQQTTVAAVLPYFERFMLAFPTLEDLARAPIEQVLKLWAGLGYYSRARLLHRSAQALVKVGGFAKTHHELQELPGFGPYTSRAVSSIAFDEKVGIVDGNVIRVLSRVYGIETQWWTTAGRSVLQEKADALVQEGRSGDTNQALMDLGAMICTPKSPKCLICPWAKSCVARIELRQEGLPIARPRKEKEIWIWKALVPVQGRRVGLIENDYAPFLKGHMIWPGEALRKNRSPKTFSFRHSITCHNIFVSVEKATSSQLKGRKIKWVSSEKLAELAPSSMVRKALEFIESGSKRDS